jgi:hypothetical protein
MITIYNSNLDFDLDSSNSITLSSTSNMVFKTNGVDKMSIVNNGISVSGNVVVSGLITSTGGGFSGIGANLTNIPISAINELRLELNGGTTELSVTRDTLNATIVSETRFGSNYTNRINSELNTRVDNTSNYVFATSNILIGRIINTSNYVDSTSNFLSGRLDNTSNYVFATSNILIGRIINTSNYVDSTSNFLSGRIDNTCNYVFATSNILIGRIINTCNYVDSTSNFLGGRIDNTSNYVFATSNILIGRVINASNYVESTSNILIGRVINASNYVDSTSNFLSSRIDNTSNYVFATSNILIGRIINASNYVLATSNILADYNNLINKPFQINGANIFNNSGNVGIGTNATPLSLMEIITTNYTGALLTLDAGIVNSTTQMPRSIGRPLLKLGKTSVSISAGDYYGIGFGISPTLNDFNCAEIGTIITSTTGLETGDIIFSTRPSTNNVIATERMRITSAGNVGIGTTDTTTYKLNVGGTLNTTALYVNGTALTTTIGLKQDVLTSTNTIGVFNTTTDFVVNGDKIELTKNTSNYVIATSNLLSKRIDSTSNYSDRVGVWGSNYTDKADIWGSNYSDRVGGWGSNYTDKADIWGSNYSDRVGVWGSNYAYDKVGVWSSNYTDRVGGWGSNYAYDKVGVWGSNYTDRIGERTSNYVNSTSNILIGRIINTSNYVSSYKPATAVRADTADKFTTSHQIANVPFDGSADISISYNALDNKLNASTGINIDVNNNISANYASTDLMGIFNTTDFADVNSKIELSKNTSNYVLATSNILIGRVINASNYIDSVNTSLNAAIAGKQATLSAGTGISISNNQISATYAQGTGITINTSVTPPTISASASAQVQSDWNATSGVSFIQNKPTIPAAQVQSNWTATSGVSFIQNKPSLFSGSYNDLSNKPTIVNVWSQYNNDIYYAYNTTGNVGIGTYLPETSSRLHIYSDTDRTTKLTIQNGSSVNQITGASPNEIDNFGTFTSYIYRHTNGQNHHLYGGIVIPTGGIVCDIFMIGGGGAGGYDRGGGGGAGACIIALGKTLTAGSYEIRVGRGGIAADVYSQGENGFYSEIYNFTTNTIFYRAAGGGGGASASMNGSLGGCGGGAGSAGTFSGGTASTNIIDGANINANTYTSTYAVLGNRGGNSSVSTSVASGGGGIEASGGNVSGDTSNGGAGGNGRYNININGVEYNFKKHFSPNASFGVQNNDGYFYIGGGGGGGNTGNGTRGSGGLGGGGAGGQSNTQNNTIGTPNTGSGGGGAAGRTAFEYPVFSGANGATGIVIIRFKSLNTSSSIELIRGTAGDTNIDYKIGNYGGDFRIISSVNNTETDYIRITSVGSSIYNPTGSPQWSTTSDRRIKENIEKASYDICYDNINKLDLYRFNYINGFNNVNKDLRQLGYIAQEVQDIFPKAVSSYNFDNNDVSIPDLLSIDITQINYSLYGAVKKLIEINEDKEKRINKLESLLNIYNNTSNLSI